MSKILERFMKHISIPEKGDGCWNWLGAKTRQGYGNFKLTGKRNMSAHRFSYRFFVGTIPKGAMILHLCDNPSCVKPGHLMVGDNAENMRQMHARGRAVGLQRGIYLPPRGPGGKFIARTAPDQHSQGTLADGSNMLPQGCTLDEVESNQETW